MTIKEYLENISKRYKTGISREHAYRGDLQLLLESMVPDVLVTNEPARIKCGAPDYIITRENIPVGFIEAKDIGIDLSHKNLKEQFDRYRNSLNNLIFTDYLDFHYYINGKFVSSVKLADLHDGKIVVLRENFSRFTDLITNFCLKTGQTITSSKQLAEMMASKARMLSDVLERSLENDDLENEDSSLKDQMNGFKEVLIHDIGNKEFADIYAQTIAYGMFAARYHDPTLENFSRQEAAELIPKTNPFLRKLFNYIAGPDIDDRIKWIVESLADVFRATDVQELMKDFGKVDKKEDPVIHFYENFLAEYDPSLRKARGVWYTPAPVVNFIVRAVDDILKTEFGLNEGLSDTSKTKIKVDFQGKKVEQEVHKVQILDPAAGTVTFLAEVIKHIHKKFEGQKGVWSNYVENHLIPRLNGFEILMASYAMAHLKLDILLKETGFKPTKEQRYRVYLTNSLEEYHPDTGTLFAKWLSSEANEANFIKRDTPVMVVIGNPPYSVSSSNKGAWIERLVADYKRELNERNIQPLSDDYIKFIRFGQHLIDKNGEGILAFITNNSFIDGLIHRKMRESLLQSFDKIYILDLHGNAKKKEKAPDGSKDENVFDIMQGVSINLFIKTGKKIGKYGQILHSEIFGIRDIKYAQLLGISLPELNWQLIPIGDSNHFFTPVNYMEMSDYQLFFPLNKIFENYNTGIESGRDSLFIDFDKKELAERVEFVYRNLDDPKLIQKYDIKNNSNFPMIENIKKTNFGKEHIKRVLYRPFDLRSLYYNPTVLRRPSFATMKHFEENNLALTSCRQQSTFDFQHILVSNTITERCTVSLQTKETGYVFPLYIYDNHTDSTTKIKFNETERCYRQPNLNLVIVSQIADKLRLTFTPEKEETEGTFAPIDILDYIYAVLHSPKYRTKYKEFLRIDFPRVPYPTDAESFWEMVKLGGELRQIHLLESPTVSQYITRYPIEGDNEVEKITYQDQKVFINKTQYFEGVPQTAWEFYIGGYQPAQKWLKDRKSRILNFEDIFHYQKIIVALTETDRLMKEIDEVFEV
ncbi:MAG: N-6 DNA methylase [Bacteroidetes bacterium]|nr:N-6 DNA methylase [Bacteroidota bacterium]